MVEVDGCKVPLEAENEAPKAERVSGVGCLVKVDVVEVVSRVW